MDWARRRPTTVLSTFCCCESLEDHRCSAIAGAHLLLVRCFTSSLCRIRKYLLAVWILLPSPSRTPGLAQLRGAPGGMRFFSLPFPRTKIAVDSQSRVVEKLTELNPAPGSVVVCTSVPRRRRTHARRAAHRCAPRAPRALAWGACRFFRGKHGGSGGNWMYR